MTATRETEAGAPHQSGALTVATERLCILLNRLGDALVVLDTDAALAIEGELGRAVESLNAAPAPEDREGLVGAVTLVQAALLRCRRLGASMLHISRAVALAGGAAVGYDRSGGSIGPSSVPSVVQVRA
jgi:hypothetical protein